nr:MAG TPA: hypothetical protein [Caudoviricetes sp.]
MPGRKSAWGGPRQGTGPKKRLPPCKRVVVQVPVVVVDGLKRKAEEEDKAFPDMLREILAEALNNKQKCEV